MSGQDLEAVGEEVRATEARGMVEGIKALFQGVDTVAELPGEYTDPDGVQRMNRRSPKQPGDHPARRRATDPVRVTGAQAKVNEAIRGALGPGPGPGVHLPAPGPWDGVPAALGVLRPTGRYDRVLDDAWRLVNAFCEARAEVRDDS